MTPLVSDKHQYILFYNPKSACSVARQIFLELHRSELSVEQQAKLSGLRRLKQDDWHEIYRLFPMLPNVNYDSYFKFTLVRHPFMRFVSAYLNRIVLQQTDLDRISEFLRFRCGKSYRPSFSFSEFVTYITESKSGEITNRHFLCQSRTFAPIAHHKLITPTQPLLDRVKYRVSKLVKTQHNMTTELDLVCKVEAMSEGFKAAYQNIFSHDEVKQRQVLSLLENLPLHNVTYTSNKLLENAAFLSAEELRSLGEMPSYTSFLTSEIKHKLKNHYADDLYNFDYSATLDESVDKFEANKNSSIQEMVPADFDWDHYLACNADLVANGINNKAAAISHWIHHGRFEDRTYRK